IHLPPKYVQNTLCRSTLSVNLTSRIQLQLFQQLFRPRSDTETSTSFHILHPNFPSSFVTITLSSVSFSKNQSNDTNSSTLFQLQLQAQSPCLIYTLKHAILSRLLSLSPVSQPCSLDSISSSRSFLIWKYMLEGSPNLLSVHIPSFVTWIEQHAYPISSFLSFPQASVNHDM
ncbi:hypothetical protein HMI55_005921, partial [Coelomomyces lativittatus]